GLAPRNRKLSSPATVPRAAPDESWVMNKHRNNTPSLAVLYALGAPIMLATLLAASSANAQSTAPQESAENAEEPAARAPKYRLGGDGELELGILLFMKEGAAFSGGVVYGPFRAGLSYATFLSNSSFGGAPDGFSLRANYILGLNASYFIAQTTDEG